MKKTLGCLVLCLCLMLTATPAATAAEPTFTLMVYMCGTDLESNAGMATYDLGEMVASGIPEHGNVTVYVQTGGTARWQVEGMADREAERWKLYGEGMEQLEGLGRQNMGDAQTLADFIASGFERYPADRYGLILWDHGGGASGGVCYDELTRDALYMPEIYGALASGCGDGQGFEFIGFDACLMASYEVACHIAPFTRYMVASEELEPGTGWSYDGWLPALAQNPGISMEKLGPMIADSFIRATLENNGTDYATMSVMDLSKLEPLKAAVEAMGQTLNGQIDAGNLNALSRLRQNVRSFGEVSDAASDMVDMTTFAEIYARYDQDGAQAIKRALGDVVIYSRHTNNLSGVTGLSILVPFATRHEADSYLEAYEAVQLSPDYSRFVARMIDGVNAGAGSVSFGTPSVSQQSIQSAQIDWFSQYANDQESYQSEAGSLWDQLYGDTDMTQANAEAFSLDSFLNTLFASGSSAGLDPDYDGSEASLWGDAAQYSDDSFATDSGYGSGLWGSQYADDGQAAADEGTSAQEVTVNTDEGDVTLNNPFANTDSEYAYTVQLTQEQLEYLGKVEANLMMDLSDPDFECYVELGYVQDVVVDWGNGKIYGMFDGTWPTLDGQMVCMYDQIANERYIRSLIPAMLNGDECYLLVVFDEENPGGKVMSTTEGYTDAGLPARITTPLEPGDVVIPMYELLYWDADGEQQAEPFEGDEIIVGDDGSIPFAYEAVETDADYAYGFCLTDVFGDSQFTEFFSLSF